jgi:RNA polymerase sigma-70 factor (ECF subfamily)
METDSFHRLYEAHAKDVYRYSLYLTGNPAEAEEITMAVFFRAWTGEPVRDTTARSFLLTIARNLFLDERRRAARHQELLDNRTAPATQQLEAEMNETLAALRGLPEAYRRPLELWALGGLGYDEIAAELGLSTSVVKVRIHRARQMLAQRLGR